ncbi:HutD/Ves family protein [Aquamicrobium ahrensii]|uniref:Environmental stress-induced protein Ves n=1 Tax=Aquamicrobium ahrensii TaxID=469551 RepID=A0ABV2KM52_9HYPH
MKIARRAGHKRMAWKNGQGLTEEVAAFPAGSDVDSFDWRLSIAHVEADGPFSVFAGVDRTIALLDGAGLALDLPERLPESLQGARTVELTQGGAPFAFSGDWTISSRNLGGPTIDLNIMTRRGRCIHEMRRLTLAPGETLTAPGAGWVVFNSPATIEADGQELAIERFDAIALDAGESFSNRNTEAKILLVTISPAA